MIHGSATMKIRYFRDTDTLYIEFREAEIAETRNLDENTQIDLDERGTLCGLTLEHASQRTDPSGIDYQQVAP
jgi:uncharacterized protein YuzE